VQFLGFVPYNRIDEQFDGASIFVNTSESEGFPNTFLQAWARGIPTVSFVDAGARLDGRPVGRQVATLDEMADAVSGLASLETVRILEGQRCLTYFEANHLLDRTVDLYENIFDALLTDTWPGAPPSSDPDRGEDPSRTR
jgi:glycosyltransferase involved in cell wall biosynthesis